MYGTVTRSAPAGRRPPKPSHQTKSFIFPAMVQGGVGALGLWYSLTQRLSSHHPLRRHSQCQLQVACSVSDGPR